jgi:hypothetical protein
VAQSQPPRVDEHVQSDPTELSFDEAIALYYGEWVLMRVTAVDEHDNPSRGYVIAHSTERDDISDALRRELPRAVRPSNSAPQRYYTFSAFARVHIGETEDEAAARFAAQRAWAKETRRALGWQ